MAKEFNSHGFELLLDQLGESEEGDAEFDREACRDRALERYRLLWSKINYFLERRGCQDHEDGADETISRVTSLLPHEREKIKNVQAFCLGVARLVCYEYLRMQAKIEQLPDNYITNPPAHLATYMDDEERARSEEMVEHMSYCFNKLPLEDQELMRRYVGSGRDGRQKIAEELGVSLKTLQERRIFSIRKRLRHLLDERLGRSQEMSKRPLRLANK
ncbi:MAG: sigma-70 family RNA polymerase sigma factor [Chloracidobacterium sp.]|nr:sigma-70 family RNA polymerase sigma factor [Chloracidobacterium sp.]